jgi:hypothetical protein
MEEYKMKISEQIAYIDGISQGLIERLKYDNDKNNELWNQINALREIKNSLYHYNRLKLKEVIHIDFE